MRRLVDVPVAHIPIQLGYPSEPLTHDSVKAELQVRGSYWMRQKEVDRFVNRNAEMGVHRESHRGSVGFRQHPVLPPNRQQTDRAARSHQAREGKQIIISSSSTQCSCCRWRKAQLGYAAAARNQFCG